MCIRNVRQLRNVERPSELKPKTIARELHVDEVDAQRGYETFHGMPPGSATLEHVTSSSASIVGWSNFARSHANTNVDHRQAQQRALLNKMGILDEVVAQRILVAGAARVIGRASTFLKWLIRLPIKRCSARRIGSTWSSRWRSTVVPKITCATSRIA